MKFKFWRSDNDFDCIHNELLLCWINQYSRFLMYRSMKEQPIHKTLTKYYNYHIYGDQETALRTVTSLVLL